MNNQKTEKIKYYTEGIGNLILLFLFFAFIALYAFSLTGKLDPLKDNTILWRIEPVIFILIGYYFGRYPSRNCEKTLKEEITRQTQRADAAQYSKEKAQQESEILEEKIKNAQLLLKTAKSGEEFNVEIIKSVSNILNI